MDNCYPLFWGVACGQGAHRAPRIVTQELD